MRTVAITIQNEKKLEIFVEKRKKGFEVWIVGPIGNRRLLLDHRLTHDDLEKCLEYAEAGDLVWRDAADDNIPLEKHPNAVEAEAAVKRGTFWDYHNNPQLDEMEALARRASGLPTPAVPSQRSVANHLDAITLLADDNATGDAEILGQWTDRIITMKLEKGHILRWFCTDRQHPLNSVERIHGHAPDWWNFAAWRLHLMNSKHKCGTQINILYVGKDELHVFENGHPHRIAHIFKRIGRAEGETERS